MVWLGGVSSKDQANIHHNPHPPKQLPSLCQRQQSKELGRSASCQLALRQTVCLVSQSGVGRAADVSWEQAGWDRLSTAHCSIGALVIAQPQNGTPPVVLRAPATRREHRGQQRLACLYGGSRTMQAALGESVGAGFKWDQARLSLPVWQ